MRSPVYVYPGLPAWQTTTDSLRFGLRILSLCYYSFVLAVPAVARKSEDWWRRWESNPCPQNVKIKALHVYFLNIPLKSLKNRTKFKGQLSIFSGYSTEKPYQKVLSCIIRVNSTDKHAVLTRFMTLNAYAQAAACRPKLDAAIPGCHETLFSVFAFIF